MTLLEQIAALGDLAFVKWDQAQVDLNACRMWDTWHTLCTCVPRLYVWKGLPHVVHHGWWVATWTGAEWLVRHHANGVPENQRDYLARVKTAVR